MKNTPAYRGTRGTGGELYAGVSVVGGTLTITPWHRRSRWCIAQIVKGLFGCAKQCNWKAGHE
jgi:hypothetical protein